MDLKTLFTDIANAIRVRKKTADPIKATDFPTEILLLPDSDVQYPAGGTNTLNAFLKGEKTELTSEDLTGVEQINNYQFYEDTHILKATFPQDVKRIRNYAFANSSLKEVIFNEGVTTIYDNSFQETKITSLVIPSSVVSIFSRAFYKCTSLVTADLQICSMTAFGQGVFENCTILESVILPDVLTLISSNCFKYCYELKNITFPEGLTTIQTNAFYSCSLLTELTLPSTITTIANGVFNGCSNLTKLYIKATTPPTLGDALTSYITEIYIPKGTLSAYESATNWSSLAGKFIEMDF